MSHPCEPVTEFDLLAYADGNLDGDPERKREVEAYLEARPEIAARVRAFARQDEVIRDHYGGVLDEPVPERLRMALDAPPRKRGMVALKAAAAAVLLIATATGSWLLGRSTAHETAQHGDRLMAQAVAEFLNAPASGVRSGRDMTGARSLPWFSDRIALELRAPDLSAEGFRLADKRLVGADDREVVEVSYVNGEGRRIILMLHPRWQEAAPDVRIDEQDGVAVAYWADGPLAFGLASDVGAEKTRELADSIRQSMRGSHGTEPKFAPQIRTGIPKAEHGMARTGPGGVSSPQPGRGGPVGPNVIQHN